MLTDQRGAVGPDIGPDDDAGDDDPTRKGTDQGDDDLGDDDGDGDLDVLLDLDGMGGLDDDPGADDLGDDDKGKDKDKKSSADKGDKGDDKKDAPTVEGLQKQLKDKDGHITNLNKALHQERSLKKADKEQVKDPLTKNQLVKILEENQDDPATLYNIVEYIAGQAAQGAKKDALNEGEIASKVKEVDGLLSQEFPDLSVPDSQMRGNVDDTKRHFGIESHPFGDLFGTAVNVLYNLKEIVEKAENKGKESALKEKADGKRKQNAKDTNLTSKGKGAPKLVKGELSSKHEVVAKQMNMTKSQRGIYANLVNKKSV